MKKKTGFLLLSVLLILFVAIYFLFYVPYTKIKAKGMAVVVSAKDLKDAFSKNDIDLLSTKLQITDEKYSEFEK